MSRTWVSRWPPLQRDASLHELPWGDILRIAQCEAAQSARQHLGTDHDVLLPVWVLRFTHDRINARMVFGHGRCQDTSIYDTVHELFSERITPDKLPPLHVVLDNDRFFSVSNRRLVALQMFQALRRHEVIWARCRVYAPSDPQIAEKYRKAKTTTRQLGEGLGVSLHSERTEAWHMGRPLFRSDNEWCDAEGTSTPQASRDSSTDATSSPGKSSPKSPAGHPPTLLPFAGPEVPPAFCAAAAAPPAPPVASAAKPPPPRSAAVPPASPVVAAAPPAPPVAAAAPPPPPCSPAATPQQSSHELLLGPPQAKVPVAAVQAPATSNSSWAAAAASPAGPPHVAVAVPPAQPPTVSKVSRHPTEAMSFVYFEAVHHCSAMKRRLKAAQICGVKVTNVTDHEDGPDALIVYFESDSPRITGAAIAAEVNSLLAAHFVGVSQPAPPRPPQQPPAPLSDESAWPAHLASGPTPAPKLVGAWAKRAAPAPPPASPLGAPLKPLSVGLESPSAASGGGLPVPAVERQAPPTLFSESVDRQLPCEDVPATLWPLDGAQEVASSGLATAAASSPPGLDAASAQDSLSGDAGDEVFLESVVGVEHVPREPRAAAADSDDEDLPFRADSDDDDVKYAEPAAAYEEERDDRVRSRAYENHTALEEELSKARRIGRIADLKGTLVYGVFRCTSGSDHKGRRCRGELLVEKGPAQLLGSRVHIVGVLNRNAAWHCDRAWVRISMAKVGNTGTTTMESSWSAGAADRTILYGRVVLAQEGEAGRQRRIVCLRSKIVRSLKRMMFRAINGKFPWMTVPWNPEVEPPSLFELHEVEVKKWDYNDPMPIGEYKRRLSLQDGDDSILRAVRISLNFCDWESDEDEVVQATPARFDWSQPGAKRENLTKLRTIAIEQGGVPAGLAVSCPTEHTQAQPRIYLHLVDVNHYLNEVTADILEKQMARRAVGAWFTDWKDRPLHDCLRLLPESLERKLSFETPETFETAEMRFAVTFSFPVKSGKVDLSAGTHFESVVRCERRLDYHETEKVIRGEGSPDHIALLRNLHKLVGQVENAAEERGHACIFEHLERRFVEGAADNLSGVMMASRIAAGCAYIVNRYAGEKLADPALWQALLKEAPGRARVGKSDARGRQVMPLNVHAHADTERHRNMNRLLQQCGEPAMERITTKDVAKALRGMLSRNGLNAQQQHCLRMSFVRQLRNCLPSSSYALVNSAKWPRAPGSADASASADADIFASRPKIFHVAGPLRRYIDVLGIRVLKLAAGWKPKHDHMLLTQDQLSEAIARTNARQDALRFADGIFRQISLMREMEQGGRRIKDAVIGNVTPGSFEVIVPLVTVKNGDKVTVTKECLRMSLPISCLRSAGCFVEYNTEEAFLSVSRSNSQELDPHVTARWKIEPWGGTKLECVLARNFAQPVKHHASLTSVIPTDLTFRVEMQGRSFMTLSIGHSLYPEVFSTCPDLRDWHRVELDIDAYSRVWHAIRLCQTHAAAVASGAITKEEQTKVDWYAQNGRRNARVRVLGSVVHGYQRGCVRAQDLCILRCTSGLGEATLYGTVGKCLATQQQTKTRMCLAGPGGACCAEAKCPFAHSHEEMKPLRFEVTVALSKISCSAWEAQKRWLDSDRVTCTVQFVQVPPADKRCLDELLQLPARKRTEAASPMLQHITVAHSREQKHEMQEVRPLASVEQVKRAMQCPCFRVFAKEPNDCQKQAVRTALQRPFSCVQGPPGTGKTTFLVHLASTLLNLGTDPTLEDWSQVRKKKPSRNQQMRRMLICTPSNHAADEVMDRLVRHTDIPHDYVARVYARTIEASTGSKYKGASQWECCPNFEIRPNLLEHALHFKTQRHPEMSHVQRQWQAEGAATKNLADDAKYERTEGKVLESCKIVVTTCTAARVHSALSTVPFTTVIIDEAAQATEPDVLLPAMLAQERVVLVGDHKQLGPVITENNLCQAYLGALARSMLERLHRCLELLPEKASTMLNVQYRMHSSIRSFPSEKFYRAQLRDDASIVVEQLHPAIWPTANQHVVFVDCKHPHEIGRVIEVGRGASMATTLVENNTSLQNVGEANLVAYTCKKLFKLTGCHPSQVAVITPYRAQQHEIRTRLLNVCGEKTAKEIVVGTVYAMQGSERDFIVLSFVRSTAEGTALTLNAHATAATDLVVVDEREEEAARRQINETHIGILSNEKVLNVSLTRAKQGLVIIGNRTVLSDGSQDFLDLSRHLQERNCVISEHGFRSLGDSGGGAAGSGTLR